MNKNTVIVVLVCIVAVVLFLVGLDYLKNTGTKSALDAIENSRKSDSMAKAYQYANLIEKNLLLKEPMGNIQSYTDITLTTREQSPDKMDVVIEQGIVAGGYMVMNGYRFEFNKDGTIKE